jgi:hypothetical protein
VPFCVRPKGGEKKWSHFDVALERDSSETRERPVFVREGIIISDLWSPLNRGGAVAGDLRRRAAGHASG